MPDIVISAINAKWIHPSFALRLLKANLGSLEKNCEIMEFALRQPLAEKVEPVLAARPKILGLSVSIWNHKATFEFLETLSEKWKALPAPAQKPVVVLGGPEVSWLPEDAGIFRFADFVIRGEGENSFAALCAGIFSGGIKAGASAVFINSGHTTTNLDKISSPYRLYTDDDLKRKLVYVESSRGCPFGCEFCLSSLDKKAREFPLEPFLIEMEDLIDRGGRTFKFLDRTFNLDIKRAVKILDYFLRRIDALKKSEQGGSANESRPLCVHFEMVPSNFPPLLKESLRRFPPGSLRIELGIQTLNPETARLVNRSGFKQNSEELELLEFLRRETSALIHADLIAGLPGEDLLSFGSGFDRLWQVLSAAGTAPFEIQMGILKCLPGTPIVRHNESCLMRYSPEPPYEVIETGALPAACLEKVKNFARFWELIVNRNPFPDLLPRLIPRGFPAFDKFMTLSGELLKQFGRNWGIDRAELKQALILFLEKHYWY